jgi:serine/threonine protein kinase
MELCKNGSLEDQLLKGLSWMRRIRIAEQVAKALSILHSHGICHRDVKDGNVLLDEQWEAKLCDHGLAVSATCADRGMYEAGTLRFTAPEILLDEDFDERADVFSFGVLLWMLLFAKTPASVASGASNDDDNDNDDAIDLYERHPRDLFSLDIERLREAVETGLEAQREAGGGEAGGDEAVATVAMSSSAIELASQCCALDPNERPATDEIVDWLHDLDLLHFGENGTLGKNAFTLSRTAPLSRTLPHSTHALLHSTLSTIHASLPSHPLTSSLPSLSPLSPRSLFLSCTLSSSAPRPLFHSRMHLFLPLQTKGRRKWTQI